MAGAETEVAVIGAGPAGAVAACLLARKGRSVALFDPRLAGGISLPWKPGDALPGAASRLLRARDLPLPDAAAGHRPLGGNVSAWGDARPVHRDFLAEPDGAGWRLDRPAFEARLIDAAVGAGVRTDPNAIRNASRDGTVWRLDLRGGGAMSAGWLIDATGRAAVVARKLGARRRFDEKLVAVVGLGRAVPGPANERSLVETVPAGWWYAALQPDRRPVFMLHTTPDLAHRLLADPAAWQAELAGTRMIAAAFPDPVFDAPTCGFEACGAWLDRVHGDGWTACGDAALSFDPCAAQGIFSALWGGMAAADAVAAALAGDPAPLAAYAGRLKDIRAIYRGRVTQHYADERRWPAAPFWAGRAAQPEDAAARA